MSADPDLQIEAILDAPEFFVEGYRGTMSRAGVAKLNFFSNRYDPYESRIVKVAVTTLVVPIADLVQIASALSDFVKNLQAEGVLHVDAPAAQTEDLH